MTILLLKIVGALALLIYGMKVMSEALQKLAGPQLRHVLSAMTTNRVSGVFTGMLTTVAVQSSTATTVMTVSFVNAGLLTLFQAISVIMGANIGTTLTAWIMSAGFSFRMSDFVWPVFLIGLLLIYSKKNRYVGDFLFGVAFMFLALATLGESQLPPEELNALKGFFASFDPNSFGTILLFLLFGTILTCLLHSSAALMAITMMLCTQAGLPIYLGIALVLGENIGTTLTANLVALTVNTEARRAAFGHLFFNVFGVIWVLCVFKHFVNFACGLVGFNPMVDVPTGTQLTFALAAFHSCFNVSNTIILLPFVKHVAKVCCWVWKPRANTDDDDFRLRFIQSGIMKTPELSVLEAQKEIQSFAERIQRMFGMVRDLLGEKNEDKFVKIYDRIDKYENISDNMEIEIAKYLDQVSNAHLSDETKGKIRSMLRQISELESIGDACNNMGRTINRKFKSKEDFNERQYDHIHQMFELVDDALSQMNVLLKGHREELNATRSFNIENEINNYRNQLRNENLTDINNHQYDYASGSMYMDIIQECEKLGDYVVNVVEARMGMKASA
ncbi:MAG: Na/Pi cotransporter family protein [Prevotella sp.]|nr:Na/Pi cotransporter family protein [Prevotella sp.]MDD7189773.1 Na/Pi cotransporter family protein [Prevotella sp.]MDY5313486.1 Na/Pi cotransporter family protein [Prevotella sp.]